MSRLVSIACLISLSSQVHAADKYALLIGVSKYDHSVMKELQFPEEDAKALGQLLKAGGYEADLLLGKNATQKAILEKLAKLNQKGSADGVVLIGLFGHGVEIVVRDEQGKSVKDKSGAAVNESCFCPVDTGVQLVLDENGRSRSDDNGKPLTEPDPASLVKLSEIMIRLNVAKAGNRVVLADCCRTIPNQARGRSFGASFQFSDLPPKTSVLFGCSKGEEALENPQWGHGAFTKCLLDELPKLALEGDDNTGALAGRLRKKVPALVSSSHPGNKQTPTSFVTDIVDFQFASVTPAKPPATAINRAFEGAKAGDRKELNGISFRWCPAGTFTMGSPKTEVGSLGARLSHEDQVNVTLSSGFWLGETELTQGQWQKVMGTTPWTSESFVRKGADYPASCLNYDDALAFCQKLTTLERNSGRLPKGWKFSLPTEAQWEYACRAGTRTKYSFGDNEGQLGDYAWFGKNAWNINEMYAHQVGQKKPNGWGLRDMHGNVFEWCSDWYGDTLPGGVDPVGPSSGKYRILRGGNWVLATPESSRSANRYSESPDARMNSMGVRVAAVPE